MEKYNNLNNLAFIELIYDYFLLYLNSKIQPVNNRKFMNHKIFFAVL